MNIALGAPVESCCVSAAPSHGRLLNLPCPSEPAWVRWVFGLLGLATAVAFLVLVLQYHEPGPCWPGIDENAYLLGGKNFAHTLTTGMKPPDPYAYISMMWFRTDQGWYYPKYPLGVPLLHALAVTVGQGNQAAFYTSPVCATLAVLAMFLLTRLLVAGSVAAWLAAVLLAANPTVLYLAMVPSSHAPALCFCLWGMYALFRWWRWGNVLVGIAAGLLLGFTAMIRYSEGLLGLPLALAALSTVRWRQWRSYVRSATLVLAWAVPVGSLLLYNWLGSGHLTGYDSTNESVAGAAFTWKHFAGKWEFTLQQLHMYGLFCILPLGVLAILLMFSWSWRAALALVLWLVPSVLLYMAYYWGRQAPGVGYLRFFLTVYPALIAAALWLISQAARGLTGATPAAAQPPAPSRARLVGAWLGGAAYTAAIATVGIYVALPDLQQHYKYNANLAFSAKSFLQAVPQARHHRGKPVPIIFCDEGGMFSRLLMHMQFAADGQWYSVNAFTPRGAGRSMMRLPSRNQGDNPDQIDHPVLVQPARQQITRRAYEDKTATDLAKLEADLVQQALSQSRGVYALLSQGATSDFIQRMRLAGFECKVLSKWTEPIGTTQPASRWPFLGSPPGDRSNRGFGRLGRWGADMNTKALSPPGRGFMRFGDMAQSLQVVQVLKQAPEQP